MKKSMLALLLVMAMLGNLCACTQTETPAPPVEEVPETPQEQPVEVEKQEDDWTKNLPRMDGSTSLIPLEAGIRSALLGISIEEATEQVSHSTTHDSFYNLVHEGTDLIFTVPPSEQQYEHAKSIGVELEEVAIAKEGFIFVVNANNPVESLTQEQLRGIYSGEITNWSEVGGNDQEIIAYQRNLDSGSQNYMTTFMGNTPLMDAPSELRPATMFGLMDEIAINDYAEQSIGYSVYAYAADMYGNGDEIKFLAVDGVAPSKATMASGEYPLMSDNYAIFRADEPEDSPVRKLCEWMISDEGQRAIGQAGYVTVRDMGIDYEEMEQSEAPYSAIGTGAEPWETSLWESKAASTDTVGRYDEYYCTLPLNITLPEGMKTQEYSGQLFPYVTGIEYTLDCLTNKDLEADINAWIAEAIHRADERSDEFYAFLEKLNGDSDFELYSQQIEYIDGNYQQRCAPSAVVKVHAKNGYIWATVEQMYWHNVQGAYEKYYRTESKTWDLFSGEEVPVEALFVKDLDVGDYLYRFLREKSVSKIDAWTYPEMNGDFLRLENSGWTLTPGGFYVDSGAMNFVHGLRFAWEEEQAVLCSEIYRDMSDCFETSLSLKYESYLKEMKYPSKYRYLRDEFCDIRLLGDAVKNADQINSDVLARLEPIKREDAVAYFTEKGYKEDEIEDYMFSWYSTNYADRFVVFGSYGLRASDYVAGNSVVFPDSAGCWLYDIQSGERMEWQDLLKDGWKEKASISLLINGDIITTDWPETLPELSHIDFDGEKIYLGFEDYSKGDRSYEVVVPLSYLNYK